MNAVMIYEEAARKLGCREIRLTDFRKLIKPLTDVEPVRRGRWIPCHPLGENNPNGFLCSACGNGGWEETDFCPHCGAKMESRAKSN